MEGKTTVSCNLAIAMADRGARVLLIDADLRQPRLHQVFDLRNEAGLCTLLGGRKPINEGSLRNFALKTRVPLLHLLPSGICETSIPNLLSSDRLSQVLQRARSEFDMVLVDTPPMLYLTDARILGKVVDGVVMVFRARRTNTDHAARAIRSLHQDGTHVLGAVLNDFDVREVGDWYLYQKYYDCARNGSAAVV
jgi:capsular exopolysaccharide synthesis family protein